jgi:hypothetical protein
MLLNLRVLVVAVLAAVAGIGCGLGLFATFRVHHEPLTRLSDGGPPLQLALDHPYFAPDGTPLGAARAPLNGASAATPAPVLIPVPSPPGPAADSDVAVVATSTAQTPDATEPTGAAADHQDDASVVADQPVEQSTAGTGNEPAAQSPQAAGSVDQQPNAAPAEEAGRAAVVSTATPAASTVAEQAAPAPSPASKETAPRKAQENKTAKPPPKTVRKPIQNNRPKIVRVRRTPTTATAQSTDAFAQRTYQQSAYQQPLYQWTDPNAQPAQVRRVVVKHRVVKRVTVQSNLTGAAGGLMPAAQSNVTGATAGALTTPY